MMSRAIHLAFLPLLFSHWAGFEFMLVYAALLGFSIAVVLFVKESISADSVLIPLIFIVSVFLWINAALNIGVINEYFFIYLYYYISVFVLVAFIILSGKWGDYEFICLARLIFWVAFLSIFLEFFGVNFFDINKAQFPSVRYSPSYFADFMGWHRPFGLTGQPSVNGGILLLSYLLLRHLNLARPRHIVMLNLGGWLTISGQAIISVTIILLVLSIRKYKSFELRTALMLLAFGLLILVLDANIFQKISIDYLIYTLVEKSNTHTIGILDLLQFMFGAMGMAAVDVDASSEVFFVESILRHGVVFTLFYWGFIWLLVQKSTMPLVWFLACVLTSLHYPTVYYIEAQLILGLLYASTSRNCIFPYPYRKNDAT